MKEILISIKPEQVEKIASGDLTILVRKTRPKLEPPFKCYIYCTKTTKNGEPLLVSKDGTMCFADYRNADGVRDCFVAEGTVIGEFVCNRIDKYPYTPCTGAEHFIPYDDIVQTGMDGWELYDYLRANDGYGWHISDLKIYDKPVALEYYGKPCKSAHYEDYFGVWYCEEWEYSDCGFICPISSGGESDDYEDGGYCMGHGRQPRFQPPSDWCYVEEVGEL